MLLKSLKNDLINSRKSIVTYHKPLCGTVSSLFLSEKVLAEHCGAEQVVLQLTQNFNHARHLQQQSALILHCAVDICVM